MRFLEIYAKIKFLYVHNVKKEILTMANNPENYKKLNIHEKLKFKEEQTTLLENQSKVQKVENSKLKTEMATLKKAMEELEEKMQKKQELLDRPGREENIKKSLRKLHQQIMKKDQDKTKPITIRIQKETLEFIKQQEHIYQKLINRILDSWVYINKYREETEEEITARIEKIK
jgi:uncharacterized protein (DUF4415 family)